MNKKKNKQHSFSLDQDWKFVRESRSGDERATMILIQSCEKIMNTVIRKYQSPCIMWEDLHQEAVIGVIQAIKGFDIQYGVRFSTYASYWIRQAVLDTVNQQIISLPLEIRKKRRDIYNTANMHLLATGQEITVCELSKELALEESEIIEILKYTQLPVPLENFWETAYEEADQDSEEDFTQALLSTLPELERQVLCLRYGITEKRSYTLKEISYSLGLTMERVRQIEKKALHKLVHPARKRGLRGLWTEEL